MNWSTWDIAVIAFLITSAPGFFSVGPLILGEIFEPIFNTGQRAAVIAGGIAFFLLWVLGLSYVLLKIFVTLKVTQV